ncbi:hypothetical protein KKH23_01945 [Patescibacteria group bacterium]|nr:hypothetical protein [Patescibacteria group bacterium]MBU0777004.1 hypothetical protein [Patescibacteria group bacterium]MBU0845943.1 hypothetical protein [Patescibacteria group bacterium]MBU1844598.1 hypothetical protein [Patescibacteria group bacterium]
MNKATKVTVDTPVGKIVVEPDATPSKSATATISEMKDDIEKIVESGTVSLKTLLDDPYECE